ncbi:hypothetical protein N7478_011588 [Penicillium angulare]|uniref:uncharacterized protein n=1 Tax=Penicillium angulare TaxID=116970 RepID=UPI0025419D32|nr:uncharacterized protein N7478_011588 [Penicillium angulare]KAJ5260993.1 hypothetical protein N7478_011588 [Penicillium angulare]
MEPEDLETASERDYNAMNSDETSKEEALEAVLDWDSPTDPNNPRNFKTPKKVFITACFASLVYISTFNSSVMSPASEDLMQEFGISKEVSVLATSLFVLGFAVGPIIFGPASEVLGRKYPLSLGVFLFAIFSIPVAVAKNVTTIFVCRFFCGTFGAAPLAIAGGGLADIWEPLSRGVAVAGFASATFLGPVLGPLAFEQHRGWDIGIGSLPFLSITIGVLLGVIIIIVHTLTRMKRKLETVGDAPEERLVPMMFGSILMPAGMFWFAWTSNPHITWVPQVVSGVFIGCGILLIFLQGLNYIIDVYKVMANSAISINAMFRGLLGAGFPLFASYMFNNLGVPWAMSLLAFLCVALVPAPFLFFLYGVKIHGKSGVSDLFGIFALR